MIVVTASIRIDRPLTAVFDTVSDARNEPHWLPGAREVSLVTQGPVEKGARFRGLYDRAGVVELELTEFERPTRVTFHAHSRMIDFDDAVHLSELEGATLLEARMTARPKGLMRLFAFVMRRVLDTQFRANWGHLKSYLETQAEKPVQ